MTSTPSVMTLTLHAYLGMLEYNQIFKGSRTLGTECTEDRFTHVFNTLATTATYIQSRYTKSGGKLGEYVFNWRAWPWLLHHAYNTLHGLKYISIEKHFGLGRKYDDKDKFIVSELCNPTWSIPAYEAVKGTHYSVLFSFLGEKDTTWFPKSYEIISVDILDSARYMEDIGTELLDFAIDRYRKKMSKKLFQTLQAEYPRVLIALFMKAFFGPELWGWYENKYTMADYDSMYMWDILQNHKMWILDYGFQALHREYGIPYKTTILEFPKKESE